MSQVKNTPIIEALEAAVVDFVIQTGCKLGKEAIKALFHAHKEKIVKAALPVTINDLTPCPPGFIRDPRTGECITDPGK